MSSSFTLVRVRGIRIGANWSWLLILGVIIWSLGSVLFPETYPGLSSTTHWAMAVAAAVLFFISLLLHELGHAFRAQAEGMEVGDITLWIFGGVARFKGMFPTAGAEFRIAIAGPLVTVAIAAGLTLLTLLGNAVGMPDEVVGVTTYLAQINVILLVFNMVPALPLDGGRVLRAFLWHRRGSFVRATVSSTSVARVLAGVLIGAGALFFLTGFAFQGIWFAFIGWFLLQAAQAELSYALFRQSLADRSVRELMTPDPETVDPEMTIASFIEDVAHMRGHSTYPVIGREGLEGLVSLRLAAKVPSGERRTTTVRNVMLARDDVPTIAVDGEITEAIVPLQAAPGRAVVMDDGRVVGLLSISDVARAIELEQLRSDGDGAQPKRSRRLVWFLVAAGVVGIAGFVYTPPFVVLAPGAAFDVTEDISIEGRDVDEVDGEYLLTSVAVEQPNGFGLLAAVAGGRDVLSLSAVVPSGVDPEEYFDEQRTIFREAQTIASAAAARAAGLEVEITGTGAVVGGVVDGSPADGVLREGDVITEIEGETVTLASDVSQIIRSRPSGSEFDVSIERDGAPREVTIESQSGIVEGSPGVGIFIETREFDVEFPFDISFEEREIGGPSAGLAYALAVYDLLSDDDLADGRTIATTGTMNLDGDVGQVGGVDQKAIAAQDEGALVFLVPEGEVEQAGTGSELDVRGVATLEEAIDALES